MKTYEITFRDTHQKMSPSFALDLAIAFFFFDIMALPSAVYYWGIAEKNVVVVIQHPKINNVPAWKVKKPVFRVRVINTYLQKEKK